MEIPESLRELIESGALAHLATVNGDGSPQVTVIWIGLDGGELISTHMGHSLKLRNIERDPRVMITIEGRRDRTSFLSPYAAIKARARVERSDDLSGVQARLAKAYMVPEFELPDLVIPGYIARYTVERISGAGPWVPPKPDSVL